MDSKERERERERESGGRKRRRRRKNMCVFVWTSVSHTSTHHQYIVASTEAKATALLTDAQRLTARPPNLQPLPVSLFLSGDGDGNRETCCFSVASSFLWPHRIGGNGEAIMAGGHHHKAVLVLEEEERKLGLVGGKEGERCASEGEGGGRNRKH